MEVQAFQSALLSMDRIRVGNLLKESLAREGRMQAIESLVVPAMQAIGTEWEQGRLALAQVYMSGRICEQALDALILEDGPPVATGPRIGLAVFMDQHQLGKRIVASVLKASGYRVLDYGQGLDAETLARMALADRVPMLMVSVLMLHSAMHLKELRQALGTNPEAPVLVVGGAPFRLDPTLGRELGLEAVGESAADAIKFARQYLGVPCPI